MTPRFFAATTAMLLVLGAAASAEQARQRWPDGSAQGGGGDAGPRTAVPRGGDGPRESAPPPRATAPAPRTRETAPPPQATAPPPDRARPSGGARERGTASVPSTRVAQPRDRVPREGDIPPVAAVPREAVPRPDRPDRPSNVYVPRPRVYNNYYYYSPRGYYPYYGYGSFGLGYFYYDPYSTYSAYPYHYDRYYDYGPFRGYGHGYPTGEVRLDVRPQHAEVFVDGYYAGRIDDFDGLFQSLRLEEGPYRIEIVAPGYEPLLFNVRVQAGRKITYRGDMRPFRP